MHEEGMMKGLFKITLFGTMLIVGFIFARENAETKTDVGILHDGKEYIQFAWWLSLFPGLAILVTVLGYNLLGEGLRDVLDPKNKD